MGEWEWPDSPEKPSYLDSKQFKAYVALVRDIIHASETPVSIGDIHRALKGRVRREWTADALEWIRDIQTIGVRPTRYQPLNRPIAGLTGPSNDLPLERRKAWNNRA